MAKSKRISSIWAEKNLCLSFSKDMRSKPLVRLLRFKDHRHRGVAMIWVAIFIGLIILLVGLSVDAAKVCLVGHQLQNGADAGALAGACYVKINRNQAWVQAYNITKENIADGEDIELAGNISNLPEGDFVIGRYIRQERTFIPTTVSVNAVKVVARFTDVHSLNDPVALNFGPIANVKTVDVSKYAIAMSSGTTGAGIIVLAGHPDHGDPTDYWPQGHGTGFEIGGTGLVDLRWTDPETGEVIYGEVQVNAPSDDWPWKALRVHGESLEIFSGDFNVVGETNPVINPDDKHYQEGAWASFYGEPDFPFSVNPDSDYLDDPLGDIDAPLITTINTDKNGNPYTYTITGETIFNLGEDLIDPVSGAKTKVLTLDPGWYPGGINLNQGTWDDPVTGETYQLKLVLTGGVDAIYALGGGTNGNSGLALSGGASLVGHGVMLYITGGPGTGVAYGKVDISGNAYIEISPRGDLMPERVVDGELGISIWQDRNNNTPAKLIGTSDFNLSGTLYFPSNHTEIGGTSEQFGNQLITGTLWLHGTGTIGIGYDGRNFIESFKSYIIE